MLVVAAAGATFLAWQIRCALGMGCLALYTISLGDDSATRLRQVLQLSPLPFLLLVTGLPLAGGVVLFAAGMSTPTASILLTSCTHERGGRVEQVVSPSRPLVAQLTVPEPGWYCLVAAEQALRFYEPLSTLFTHACDERWLGASPDDDMRSVASYLAERVQFSGDDQNQCRRRISDIMHRLKDPKDAAAFCKVLDSEVEHVFIFMHADTREWCASIPPPNGASSIHYTLQLLKTPGAAPDANEWCRVPLSGDTEFWALAGGQ